MKKMICLLLSVVLASGLSACGSSGADTSNTLSTAKLTPREEMLAGSQNIVLLDFEAAPSLKTVKLTVECYQRGVRQEDVTNLQCAIPENHDKKHKNNRGSLAVILGSDNRFTTSVCDADGSVISSAASDEVQPIAKLSKYTMPALTFQQQKFQAGTPVLIKAMAFGAKDKIQGTVPAAVFSSPGSHLQQASVFDRIYLVRCVFS